jgi:D-arabinose 1-dehydrogenase-like Zn-dependent alcohol dehydrogenase
MKTLSRHLLRFLPQNNVIINSRHYRAAVLRKFGEPLVIVDEPKQLQPHQDQLLIEVDSAGINHADVSTIQGKYHLKPSLPFTPGLF